MEEGNEAVEDEENGYLDGRNTPEPLVDAPSIGGESEPIEVNSEADLESIADGHDLVHYVCDRLYDYDAIVKSNLHYCEPNLTKLQIINDISEEGHTGLFDGKYYYPRPEKMKSSNPYFSINEDNKLVLVRQQCDQVVRAIKKFDLEKTLKTLLGTTHFNFPQEKAQVSHSFCNESVYGNCNLFFLTGFLKVDVNDVAKVKPNTVDEGSLDSQ